MHLGDGRVEIHGLDHRPGCIVETLYRDNRTLMGNKYCQPILYLKKKRCWFNPQ